MEFSSDQQPDHALGARYWDEVAAAEPTNNGVLGGFGNGSLPRVDSLSSRLFILTLNRHLSFPTTPVPRRALDIGAGIGRVSRDVLLPVLGSLATVDMVEPAAGFVQAALEVSSKMTKGGHLRMWKMPIQDFWDRSPGLEPAWSLGSELVVKSELKKYDLIWCQWAVGHLSDDELVAFLRRSARELEVEGGMIVVKENVHEGEEASVFDAVDGSLTRSDELFRKLFAMAGLVVLRTEVQKGFPTELLKVNIYALKPCHS
ncbi:hypothetical protein CROQUDRAFT_663250 [Cronartium quercuum f. sp. fusiforme G11]|uniref:Alpha N-terminal protein methyltransferase 1 n=1 Tax=Cronartium quercuum f. sp. fusiforme G11 TaxID=708437 RepID=A0A9P6T7G8_9BASI|nr:hypothetical protein CROQUDRAFT_663250 [Cronartium quercuum f. sp. fusiforme G11]